MVMLALELLRWWYGPGWRKLILRLTRLAESTTETFSVSMLMRTLFAPWRQVVSTGDRSFIESLKAGLDNLVSRFVGFGVRMTVIFTTGLVLALITFVGIILAILWPLLPLLSVYLIIQGLVR